MVALTIAEVKKLPVARVKEELAARDLPQDGLKAILVKRLIDHIQANELQQSEPEGNGTTEATEAATEADTIPAEAEAADDASAEAENPADEPAAAAEASAAAEETDVKPTVAVAETAEEGTTDEAAVTSEADADTAAEADGEAVPADSVEATKAEGGKAPGSPASVGGGEDGPPSKKAKTASGATATKRVKLTGDPSGREVFIEGIPETATDDEVKKIAEEHGTVVAVRVMRTKDEPSKCKGLALVRYNDRESAKKALETVPSQKMGESTLSARPSSNDNTLFIGNLNKTWGKDSVLKAFMESVEGIVNFELTMDALNKTQNRGFGFATFDTVESCKAAHDKYYKDKLKIMENQVLIDWAETRGNKQDDERGVYILNVDENVEDAAFKAHFEKHGTIDKVVYGRLIPHARRKDFAIINFSTRDAAKSCIDEMNGSTFMGKELEVTMAKAKRKRDFPFGGGGGGGDRRSSNGAGNFNSRGSYGGRDGGGRGGYNSRPYGGGYSGGRGGRGGGRGYSGGGGGGGYNNGGGGGYAGGGGYGAGGPYMAGGGGGRGYPPQQAYPQYHAGGQVGYQPPVAAYPQAYGVPAYGAQPVAQPYHAGGGVPQQQPWQQRQY